MKGNVRLLLVGIGLFALFCLIGNATTPSVQAAARERWARWQIETAFPNDKIDTRLIIQFGYTDQNGNDHVYREEHFPAACQTVGNLIIQDEEAIFDGSSYISCDVDSIQERVLEMSNGAVLLQDQCLAKRPYTIADLTIEKTPIYSGYNNPILQREDMAVAVPYDPVSEQAEMIVSYGNISAHSFPFNTTGTEQELRAIFQNNDFQIRPKFKVDGVIIPSSPAVLPSTPIMLSNLESTITIGYGVSATGQESYFEGKLRYLLDDPHCDGKG